MDSHTLSAGGERKCSICNIQISKYKCPGCEIRTCCLECVKKHKVQSGCTGERSKAHYIKLKEFTENDFYSDYSFINEYSRLCSTLKRKGPDVRNKLNSENTFITNNLNKPGKILKQNMGMFASKQKFNRKTFLLLKMAKQKSNITILTMPDGMLKRRNNRSYYNINKEKIFWTIEFIVNNKNENKDTETISISEYNLDEDTKLDDLWNQYKYLFLNESNGKNDQTIFKSYMSQNARNQLQNLLKKTDHKTISFYLKSAFSMIKDRFVKINGDISLAEALENQRIVEYPSIKVEFN
ncbi:hypothetical protein BB559_000275 [Furculomyces boomerangus]|uniref:HIT-type domain-containing protein n=2 Tax=Harpellales TaxID=61421 RepID=A0A2T9Z5W1_9FUNG|nr:hypothetical protein BB559_000275 [Furculomyces boomerangus]PVZ99841.1 hypothetical protein BB558_004122 [Smittium angustum]